MSIFSYPLYCCYCYINSGALLSFVFLTSKQALALNEKQTSWILTWTASLVCSIASLPSVYRFCASGFDLVWLTQNTPNDISMVCFFQAYLALDLYYGWRFYRSRVSWVTGWLHHGFYLVFLVWLLAMRLSSFFVVASILEVPTLILATGSIVPQWRSDRLFALTFFCLRLVFHTWMIRFLKHYHHNRSLWGVALLVLPMHIYWFYGIVATNVRNFRSKRKQVAVPTLNPTCLPSESKFAMCTIVHAPS
ncbi:hypothetical protein BC940DRAFT_270381 [Gongronella butleri]|nr:hypothetical protein BC940DRAFT_270381 [Gongronella butleri]